MIWRLFFTSVFLFNLFYISSPKCHASLDESVECAHTLRPNITRLNRSIDSVSLCVERGGEDDVPLDDGAALIHLLVEDAVADHAGGVLHVAEGLVKALKEKLTYSSLSH